MTRQKILIVDDAPENIHVLMEALKDEYLITAAKNGEKALRLAQTDPRPDCILLDIVMPGLSGYETCTRLKEDVRTAAIPVIFITSLTEEENEAHGLELGAVDYITKPFRPAIVKARLRNQLELKRHRDHLDDLIRARTRELDLIKEVTIESLATITEYRDPETGGHIKRTQNYVKLLAEHVMDHPRFAPVLDPKMIELLYLSAPLHDIGKVAVPDAILLKPGRLTEPEFAVMQQHTEYGSHCLAKAEEHFERRAAELISLVPDDNEHHSVLGCHELPEAEERLRGSSFLHLAGEIAHTHHEKWDGSGYPQGLSGDDIPIGGRLMAIADVYDALISHRVYKTPFPHPKAVTIILEGRGSHFDPDLVDAFLDLQEEFRQVALRFADYEEEREALSVPYVPE